MTEIKADIKITDKHGFHYTVVVKHHPSVGVSIAYYDDRRIASREYNRMLPPIGDNDSEWEAYHERLNEWTDAAISDLSHACKNYFDQQK